MIYILLKQAQINGKDVLDDNQDALRLWLATY